MKYLITFNMSTKSSKSIYERPQFEAIDISPEGVLCGVDSGNSYSYDDNSGEDMFINNGEW